jgi:transcriptional regulator with XRE-family HTH domain
MNSTQQSLADVIGTTHSAVQRAERGLQGVDDQTFESIAKAYGISITELSMAPAEQEKAREMDRALQRMRTLTAQQLARMNDLLDTFNATER